MRTGPIFFSASLFVSALPVHIERLTHRYGSRRALDNVSLSVPQGALYGLLGPNGSGKTTLFRILATLLQPSEGAVRIFGHDPRTHPDQVRRRTGVVFQDVALDEELTVLENLRTHAALHGLRRSAFEARLARLLPLFGLEESLRERAGRLSGGQKRRVDLARGLLHAPPLLLLDEPAVGLDPAARHAFREAIDWLRREEGATVVLATHAMEEADRCDLLTILDRGRIVARGAPDALKQAIGEETLWIECDHPQDLAKRIAKQLDVSAQVVGTRVQIAGPHAHDLLAPVYETAGDAIRSVTVRRPTLEDVFMVRAGHGLNENGLQDRRSNKYPDKY